MIVVDSSAIIAMILQEPARARLADAIAQADACTVSSASIVEITMVLARTLKDPKSGLAAYLLETEIFVTNFDSVQANLAQDAFLKFGKGRHPARLNLGDCFAYAAAKALNAPLLYTGDDFAKTDIRSA